MRRYRYLLGDRRRERARLQHQASIWDPKALALFDRLKVRRGWRVLEIGPGQGSLHKELRRRVRGPVDAVEPSAAFADGIRRLARRDGFGEGQLWQCHLIDAPLPRNTYDLIFARWVFLFLPNPEAHLRKLVAALKPGGVLAVWSAAQDAAFARRLAKAGFAVDQVTVRARGNGKGARHTIWFAQAR